MEEYSILINDKDILSKLNENKLKLKQINERFILLSKPINTYCKTNFINIQGIIDQIIKTTQPYFKTKINNTKHKITNYDANKLISEKANEKNAEFDAPNTVKNLVNLEETFIKSNKINFDEIKDLGYENPYHMDDFNENDNSINMNWTISDLDDINWLRFKDIQNI